MATIKKKRGSARRLGDRSRVNDEEVSAGYDNVFEVFGRANSGIRLAKAELTRIIRQQIESHGWNGIQAAKHLGTAASEVSDLMRGKINRFSQERLQIFSTGLISQLSSGLGLGQNGSRTLASTWSWSRRSEAPVCGVRSSVVK